VKSYEALRKAIAGKTLEHAKRLHLSTALVNKWQEPSTDFEDSGAFNPLDRIEVIVQTALDLAIDRDKALIPIYYLNKRFGLEASLEETCDDVGDLSLSLAEVLKEVGHLTTVASEALSEGEISAKAAKSIEEEGGHLIRRVSAFIGKTRQLTHKRLSLNLFTRRKRESA
jgi:hypothetical protein